MTDKDRPQLYRETVLKRISTPEQLDQLIRLTDLKGWLALLAVGVIILAAVGWAFTGLLEITVRGNGLLLSQGGVAALVSPNDGLCSNLKLKPGAEVHRGDVIGLIAQPELIIDLKVAADDYARFDKAFQDAMADAEKELVRLKLATNRQKREALIKTIDNIRGDLAQAEESIRAYETLYQEKLVSREILIQKRREVPAIQDKIRQNEVELKSLDAQDVELVKTEDEKVKDLFRQRSVAAGKLEQLQGKLALCNRVVSQFEGKVLEVLVREGSRVSAGTVLANIEVAGGDAKPEILLYVPAREGIRVKPGMSVHISPEYARKEEFGYVLGQVTSAGRFPVTRDRMRQTLQNDLLVDAFGGKEATFEIHVAMIPDPNTPSGCKWSSSTGYPEPLPSGSLVKAEIVVERRRPVTLLLPYLKNLLEP